VLEDLNFDEAKQSQLPFVELLIGLGYKYLPAKEVMRQRGEDSSNFLLHEIAERALMKINRYEYQDKLHKFSEKDVHDVVEELENIQLEGLIDTSRTVYNMIMPTKGGKTIRVLLDGAYQSKSFRFFDFERPERNEFHVTVEYPASGKGNIRPDIVCFVNGIPFAVIENKKSSVDVEQAMAQMVRNQNADKCPKLFVYPQLLFATNGKDMRYGTTGTPAKFFATWREKDVSDEKLDKLVEALIAKPIDHADYAALLFDLNANTYGYSQKLERRVTEQDRNVVALFDKERLLDIAKNYILYDAGTKKVMRYQQFFAINKILKRVGKTEVTKTGVRRQGGVVWHTQGSGKSLTMVMFVRALIEDSTIINPRVIIVTDRKDLDRQIKGTFENAGLKKKVIQATSGEHLLKLIKSKDNRIITTLVHKFQTASNKRESWSDIDENIFVLIDEGHRSHGGDASVEMTNIIPNACYIAFTGTPLLKNEKTMNRFGSFIDKYTIDDALEDKIILPLIYEGRYVDLRQDKEEIDRLTERLMADLSDAQKHYLQKNIEQKVIKDNPKRIVEIAYDIEKHYVARLQGTGLKAQIVAPSKFSAVMMQKYFVDSGKINTALVISDDNGIIPEGDEHRKEVEQYLKQVKDNYQSLLAYEKEVVNSFVNNEEGVEMLIVVDKLLTGFDAPRDTVLYLAKELRDHNLLQAIARVNRLFENPGMPKTAGYIIDYSENAENIHTAMQLFGNYDVDDVKGALIDVSQKIQELESGYAALHDLFNGVAKDDEAYLQHLADEPTRKKFVSDLNEFMRLFSESMALQDFSQNFGQLNLYRNELKKFENLRRSANLLYADRQDLTYYKQSLIKILDENIKAEEAELLTEEIDITDHDKFERALDSLGTDKGKAEAIAAQTQKTIVERREADPEFYGRFSKKIGEILEAMRQKKLADIEALNQLKLIKDEVLTKRDESLPTAVSGLGGADILYRNLRDDLSTALVDSDDAYTEAVVGIRGVLARTASVDWWHSHEKKRQIRNELDDYLYDELKVGKSANLSFEQIESVINHVMTLAEYNHEAFSG
jgi:type I restriction enzyme R subunit